LVVARGLAADRERYENEERGPAMPTDRATSSVGKDEPAITTLIRSVR
jgi:hypothetical protein